LNARFIDGPEGCAGADEATIVLLPLGAHEQHGPHLPLETDTLIAQGMCRALAKQAEGLDLRILPAEPVGYSPEHMDFPGSKTLSYAQAVERWIGLAEACSSQGVRRIIFMNAHGGNGPLVQIVCQELRARAGLLAVATKWDRFVKGAGLVGDEEAAFGVHGGEIETAVMLALHPDKVDMSAARDFRNLQQALTTKHLRAYGPHSFGWMAQDMNPEGVTGNAAAASAETGEKLLAEAARGLAQLCHDVAEFDLALLRSAP
jgi:creatinine amidohydrolase